MAVVKGEPIVGLCLCMLLLYNWSIARRFDYGMDSRNLKAEYDSNNATKTDDRLLLFGRRRPFWSLQVYDDQIQNLVLPITRE